MSDAAGRKPRGRYVKLALKERAAAVVDFMKCGCDIAAFVQELKDDSAAATASKLARGAARWLATFKKTSAVADLPKSGRPRKVPKAVAVEAGNLLVDGQAVTVPNPQGGTMTARVPFPDMTVALALSAPLHAWQLLHA